MTTRTITSRCSPLAGAPALLAVLAILVSAPAVTGTPVASRQVGLCFAHAVSVAGICHVLVQGGNSDHSDGIGARASMGFEGVDRGRHGIHAVQRLGPLRLVLPPPYAC